MILHSKMLLIEFCGFWFWKYLSLMLFVFITILEIVSHTVSRFSLCQQCLAYQKSWNPFIFWAKRVAEKSEILLQTELFVCFNIVLAKFV